MMLDRIIKIEKMVEKPAYVKDNITKEIRPIIGDEFGGEKITYYKIVFVNYFEIGLRIIPIEGKLDKVIPFHFWIEKEAIPRECTENLQELRLCV